MAEPVLEIRDLDKHFEKNTNILDTVLRRGGDPTIAIDSASLELHQNDSQAVIGESGCGKTTLLMTLMGLYEPTDGQILYKGKDMADFSRSDWKEFRGGVQMIFQDPFNSLDPKMTVRESLAEPLKVHGMDDRDRRIREVCERVELTPPEQYLGRLPDQLSGGEKQRVSIARALIVEPDVILADEPVSMLDVSTQASILNLLSHLVEELGVALLYISHDLSTVSYVCQDINVMYLGRIVERASTLDLLEDPKHPYSQALIGAIPILDPHENRPRTDIEGTADAEMNLTEGCRFRDRCPERMDICEKTPEFVETDDGHRVACHLYYDHEAEETEAVENATPDAAATTAEGER